MTTLAQSVAETTRTLAGRGVANAAAEAEELVAWAAKIGRAALRARLAEPLPADAALLLSAAAARRLSGAPLAYVIGEWDFREFTLTVTPDVLVPRPETEELFDLAARELEKDGFSRGSLADVGTGSGALAIAAAARWPQAKVFAVDVSAAALAVARANALRHGAAVEFLRGDLLAPLNGRPLQAVVANLPYVADAELAMLSPEVRREPRAALAGGVDGMDHFRRLAPQAASCLAGGGKIFLEVGRGQAPGVAGLLAESGVLEPKREKDFAGIERFVWGVFP